ncbi:hypothetical protein BJ912DRAFT_111017 [Pholiota molesta]|nr:hypothetical protein BJ912DRAFT_111017 [Pholiota molesta]
MEWDVRDDSGIETTRALARTNLVAGRPAPLDCSHSFRPPRRLIDRPRAPAFPRSPFLQHCSSWTACPRRPYQWQSAIRIRWIAAWNDCPPSRIALRAPLPLHTTMVIGCGWAAKAIEGRGSRGLETTRAFARRMHIIPWLTTTGRLRLPLNAALLDALASSAADGHLPSLEAASFILDSGMPTIIASVVVGGTNLLERTGNTCAQAERRSPRGAVARWHCGRRCRCTRRRQSAADGP